MRALRGKLLMLAAVPLLLAGGRAAPDPGSELAGRYYRQFPNGTIDGDKYTGEDVIEIVPVARGAAYVRIHLDYFNGHSCDIWGVARAEHEALVYRAKPDWNDDDCILKVRRAGASLSIDDGENSCKSSCGARGTLSRVSIPYSSRRPIRYLARLKSSPQYQEAIRRWRSEKPSKR